MVISNCDFVNDLSYLSPLGKSDHCVLLFSCNIMYEASVAKNKFNFNKGNYTEMNKYLYELIENGQIVNADVNTSWMFLKNALSESSSKYIPLMSGNTWLKKGSSSNYMSLDNRKLIHRKHRLWTRYLETKDKDKLKAYKKVRNKIRKETRKLTKEIQLDIAKNCIENPNKFWKFVNSKTKKNLQALTCKLLLMMVQIKLLKIMRKKQIYLQIFFIVYIQLKIIYHLILFLTGIY